jgi:RNA polymerase sigma factor (sigma-70 family)
MSSRLGVVVLTSQSDERLVSLARGGTDLAFAVIVERYGPELQAFARRLSTDGKAEDIVQQAFLSAFAALRSGAEVQHLRGWPYRIVRNTAARSRAPLCMPLDGAAVSSESVEDVVQQRVLAMDALAELARLPTRQREAMVGTALDGWGRAEVASSMGVSEGAVRQLVHRARARLRTVVTAVTPWPLAMWLATARPGSGGTADAVVGIGAGAASSGGAALKLGIVLASGAIATGVAAVDIHGDAHRPQLTAPGAVIGPVHPHALRRAITS